MNRKERKGKKGHRKGGEKKKGAGKNCNIRITWHLKTSLWSIKDRVWSDRLII